MSYEFYKILHILGIMLLFTTLGGLSAVAWSTRGSEFPAATRKLLSAAHGTAMLIIIVAGFGLMAKKGIMTGWPMWIFVKLGVWLALGAALTLILRMREFAKVWFFLVPVLGAVAAGFAIYQPH